MSVEHRRGFIASLPYFGGFSLQEIDVLLGVLIERRLADGEVLFAEGQIGDACYVVAEGKIRVSVGSGPGATDLAHLQPGMLFGQVALLDGGTRSASCTAMGGAIVLGLRRNEFDLLFRSRSSFAYKFLDVLLHLLARQLRHANSRLLKLAAEQQTAAEPASPTSNAVAGVLREVAAQASTAKGVDYDPTDLRSIYEPARRS